MKMEAGIKEGIKVIFLLPVSSLGMNAAPSKSCVVSRSLYEINFIPHLVRIEINLTCMTTFLNSFFPSDLHY